VEIASLDSEEKMFPALVEGKAVGESYRAAMPPIVFCLLVSMLFLSIGRVQAAEGGVPVFKVTPVESAIRFDVEASVAIEGKFDKWDASLTFTSPEVSTGVLDIKIQADSVDTGNGMKNNKLKGKDFFDVKQNPYSRPKMQRLEYFLLPLCET
jgi:polyisoprenoid-binding protein YceI